MTSFDRDAFPPCPYPDEPDPYTEGEDEDDNEDNRRDPPWLA